jgi:hypothetical protein
MVTRLEGSDVVPLLRVAVKMTDWPTAGVLVDGERESWVDCAAAETVTTPANNIVVRRTIIENETILYKLIIAS